MSPIGSQPVRLTMQFLIQGFFAMIVLFLLAIGVANIPVTETQDTSSMSTTDTTTTGTADTATERIIWGIE